MLDDIKAFLLSMWNIIRKKGNLKRFAWLIVALALTVLVPISIAVCYVQFVKEAPTENSPVIEVELLNPDGEKIHSAKTQEDLIESTALAKLLYSLLATKAPVEKPISFSEPHTLSFSINTDGKKAIYKCYFSDDAENSYIEDERNNLYLVDADAYLSFLNSSFSELAYEEAAPPSLCAAGDELILPSYVNWSYALNNGALAKSELCESTDELLTYRITGAISLNFEREPSRSEFTVKRPDGEVIFVGSQKELYYLTVEENSELLVSVTASWSKNEEYSASGEQKYEFKIICSEPSSFNLSANSAKGGDFIIITVTDVDSVDSITYKLNEEKLNEEKLTEQADFSASELAALTRLYDFIPRFVKSGSNAYALLPIPNGVPSATLSFSLSSGISTAEFSVSVSPSSSTELTLPVLEDSLPPTISKGQKAEFSRIIYALKHNNEDFIYFNDEFLSPEKYGFNKSYAYGTSVICQSSQFNLFASSYGAGELIGRGVKSAGTGTVTASGSSPLLGNYVIIDHGMGLCTWYCGLSDISVRTGDIIKKGDTVGRSGSSSLLCSNGVNVICSIYGELINPESVLGKTVID